MFSLEGGRASLGGVTTSGRTSGRKSERGTARRNGRGIRRAAARPPLRWDKSPSAGLHSAVRRGGDNRSCDRASVVRFRPGLHLHTDGRRARAERKAPRVEIRPEPDALARSRSLRARRGSGSRRVSSRTDSLVASLLARGSRQKAPRVRFEPEEAGPARSSCDLRGLPLPGLKLTMALSVADGLARRVASRSWVATESAEGEI